jgi:hypothetical protein
MVSAMDVEDGKIDGRADGDVLYFWYELLGRGEDFCCNSAIFG